MTNVAIITGALVGLAVMLFVWLSLGGERAGSFIGGVLLKRDDLGDDPPQIQGSPHLDRLRQYGEVILYTDRPKSREEQLARTKDAVAPSGSPRSS